LTDWNSIVRAHGPMAFDAAWAVLANAADAEDAVQEALADAVRVARDGPVDNWGGLLRRLATRRAVDLLRRRRHRQGTVAARTLPEDPPAGVAAQPDAVAVGVELAGRLRAALSELPPQQAEVFALRYFADAANAEIATQLNLTPGAVGVALHKARQRLDTLLNLHEESP
jgi:RNA polymerase sigma-70 factor (ECF subfamily)